MVMLVCVHCIVMLVYTLYGDVGVYTLYGDVGVCTLYGVGVYTVW